MKVLGTDLAREAEIGARARPARKSLRCMENLPWVVAANAIRRQGSGSFRMAKKKTFESLPARG
jgi:hypothetical protein